jgi:hypothetical protein
LYKLEVWLEEKQGTAHYTCEHTWPNPIAAHRWTEDYLRLSYPDKVVHCELKRKHRLDPDRKVYSNVMSWTLNQNERGKA